MSIEYENIRNTGSKIIRAAVYIRFSSHKQVDSYSIEYQKTECLRYLESKGYKFVKIYIDEAKTAKKTAGREALEQMVVDAGKGKFDRIIVFSFSRSFRNTRDALNYNYELMENHGVCLESVIEPIDMSTPHGKYGATNLFAMHELSSDVTAAHVRSGMDVAARQGYYLGGYVPFGYEVYETGELTRGKQRKKFKVNEEEAKIVQEIFDLYALNFSLNYIQQTMKRKNVRGRKGKILGFQTICRILRNPFYIGIRDYKIRGYEKIYLEDAVPAIIDKRLWETVQRRHADYKENNPVIPRQTKRLYALTGKAVCAKCGAHLTGVYKGNKRKENWSYSYYHCSNKKGRNTCDLLNIRKDFLENYCLEQIRKHILNPEKIKEVAAYIFAQTGETPASIDKERVQLTRRKNELFSYVKAAEKSKIEAQHKQDDIQLQATEELIDDYKAEILQINATLEQFADIEETEISIETIENYLKQLLADAESTDPHIIKSLFDKLIEKVEIHDDKVVLHLIVFPFVAYRDNLSNGQPQFSLMTDAKKDDIRK